MGTYRKKVRIPQFFLALTTLVVLTMASSCKPAAGKGPQRRQDQFPLTAPFHHLETPSSGTVAADIQGESAEDQFRNKITAQSLPHLEDIAANKLLVEAVAEANRTNLQTQDEILEKDRRWRQTPGINDPLILPYLTNSCATFLKQVQKDHPNYLELFVMDRKGCIVAESNKTSDYWQGDEDKWIKSFNDGSGKVFIDEVTYDDSVHAYVVQISVPIFDSARATIGAMTASIQASVGR